MSKQSNFRAQVLLLRWPHQGDQSCREMWAAVWMGCWMPKTDVASSAESRPLLLSTGQHFLLNVDDSLKPNLFITSPVKRSQTFLHYFSSNIKFKQNTTRWWKQRNGLWSEPEPSKDSLTSSKSSLNLWLQNSWYETNGGHFPTEIHRAFISQYPGWDWFQDHLL